MAPIAPLVWFRILFGALMVLECWGAIATGWVRETFVEPRLTFPLFGFEFLRVLAGPQAYAYFAVMGAAALGVTLGWRYRLSSLTLAVMWLGAYLAQKSHYNNHYYLAVLVAFWLASLPAHRARSLDARSGRVEPANRVDPWALRIFRLQLLIVFTYAAIAKLYSGWISGEYLAANLGSKGDLWLVGGLLLDARFQTFVTWAAIIFDGLVVPALMWRRTRMAAVVGLVAFNLFNSFVFRIGVFPYMVLAMLVFFFEDRFAPAPAGAAARVRWLRPVAVGYLAVQLLLPLRHHLIPGDVTWTEEGHRMSWRMMLRRKGGHVTLYARSAANDRTWLVPQEEFLTPKQCGRIAVHPEFLWQFVQVLKEHYRETEGITDLELYARRSAVSLNGTEPRPLYDPTIDLCHEDWHPGLTRECWILDRTPDAQTAGTSVR